MMQLNSRIIISTIVGLLVLFLVSGAIAGIVIAVKKSKQAKAVETQTLQTKINTTPLQQPPTAAEKAAAVAPPVVATKVAQPACSGVTVYQDRDFGGNAEVIPMGVTNFFQGSHKVGNDTISSVKVPAGCKVSLYEHSAFEGMASVYEGPKDVPYVGDAFNDKASVAKVEQL